MKWGELSRLRGLLAAASQLAVQHSAVAVEVASNAHHAALRAVELARAGWQEQLMRDLDPALLQAWRARVAQMAGSAASAADALRMAEEQLSHDRNLWLDAQRQHDLADVHHRTARQAANRKQEERTLMTVSDILVLNSAQMR